MAKQRAKYGGEDKPRFLEALRRTLGRVYDAAKLCGISARSHYFWMQDDPEYKQQADEISEIALDLAESKLMENVKSNNQRAIEYYLNNKGKSRGYNSDTDSQKQLPSITINWTPPPPQEQ